MKKSELETEMISLRGDGTVRRRSIYEEYPLPYFLFGSSVFVSCARVVQLTTAFALGQWDSRTAVRHRVKQIIARRRSIYVLVEDSTQHCGGEGER